MAFLDVDASMFQFSTGTVLILIDGPKQYVPGSKIAAILHICGDFNTPVVKNCIFSIARTHAERRGEMLNLFLSAQLWARNEWLVVSAREFELHNGQHTAVEPKRALNALVEAGVCFFITCVSAAA